MQDGSVSENEAPVRTVPSSHENFCSDRIAMIESLYSSRDQESVTILVALERILAYCRNNHGNRRSLSDLTENIRCYPGTGSQ